MGKEVNDNFPAHSIEIINMYIIETSDLKPKSDTIHFDSPSQREMGKRFAKAVLQSNILIRFYLLLLMYE